jgi:hypothetical protein
VLFLPWLLRREILLTGFFLSEFHCTLYIHELTQNWVVEFSITQCFQISCQSARIISKHSPQNSFPKNKIRAFPSSGRTVLYFNRVGGNTFAQNVGVHVKDHTVTTIYLQMNSQRRELCRMDRVNEWQNKGSRKRTGHKAAASLRTLNKTGVLEVGVRALNRTLVAAEQSCSVNILKPSGNFTYHQV